MSLKPWSKTSKEKSDVRKAAVTIKKAFKKYGAVKSTRTRINWRLNQILDSFNKLFN